MAGKKMKMGRKKKNKASQPDTSALMKCPDCNYSGAAADVEAHARLACDKAKGKGQIALPERSNSGGSKAYVCGECTPFTEPRSFRKLDDLNQHKGGQTCIQSRVELSIETQTLI